MSMFAQLGKMAADEFASNGMPSLLKDTLVGSGLGGIAGGLYGLINPGKSKNRLIAALKKGLIGAGAGGVSGIAINSLRGHNPGKTDTESSPKAVDKPKSTIGTPEDAGIEARSKYKDNNMIYTIDSQKALADKYLKQQIEALAAGRSDEASDYGRRRASLENNLTSPTTLDMLYRGIKHPRKGIYSTPTSNFALPMPKNVEDELYN